MSVRNICAAAAVFAGLLAPSLAAPIYQVIDLGFDAVAINNRGQVVGNNAIGAVFWDPVSGITQIGTGTARDINNSGRVLGVDSSGAGWIWDPVFGLAQPTGLRDPKVMNDLGQVAGFPKPPGVSDGNGGYLWDPTFGFVAILNPRMFPSVPPGFSSADVFPRGINNHGHVVGLAGFGEPVPFYWEPGFPDAQSLIIPQPTHGAGYMNAINDHGQIAGQAVCTGPELDPGICTQVVIWNDLTPMFLGVGAAFDINNSGWVVGGMSDPSVSASAFLWNESFGRIDLDSLISVLDPFFGHTHFLQGTDINDRGWILADGHYLLSTVPEPGSLVLVALSFVGLILMIAGQQSLRAARKRPHAHYSIDALKATGQNAPL